CFYTSRPPAPVQHAEERRRGIDDEAREVAFAREGVELRAQLGMQPLVLECEPCRGDDTVEQLALVEQRRIVHEYADATVLAVDRRCCAELVGVERPA